MRLKLDSKEVLIICTPMTYHSTYDEEACFFWIDKLTCIKKSVGIGRELHLYIKSCNISRKELIGLMGLFKRYKFKNPEQLDIFKNEKNKNLFD